MWRHRDRNGPLAIRAPAKGLEVDGLAVLYMRLTGMGP